VSNFNDIESCSVKLRWSADEVSRVEVNLIFDQTENKINIGGKGSHLDFL
jgi:hypothetical protein